MTMDKQDLAIKVKRPLIITVICIIGLLISLLEMAGNFYATQIQGTGMENGWTIYLKTICFIDIICWVGFWTMRKLTLGLFILNLFFRMWAQYELGVSPFDFYISIYIIIAIIIGTQLHKMTKYI